MGTHISRVKSVDLDAWTDEQLQSILRWGNARANKSVSLSDSEGCISETMANDKKVLGSEASTWPCPVRSVSNLEVKLHKDLTKK